MRRVGNGIFLLDPGFHTRRPAAARYPLATQWQLVVFQRVLSNAFMATLAPSRPRQEAL